MSTMIMSQCWPLEGLSIAQKAVLISLADNANDQGVCWPSIATIAKRICASERAVQNAIKWLESARLVTANRSNGRHTSYTVTPAAYAPPQEMHPSTKCSGAGDSPAQEMRHTPAGNAGEPPQEMRQPPQEMPTNRKEPPSEPSVNRKGSSANADDAEPNVLTAKHLVADGVDKKVARDWLTLRKAKRLPLTPTAWDTVKDEAAKVSLTAGEAVKYAVASNWAGFKASWVQRDNANAVGGSGSVQASASDEWWIDTDRIVAKGAELGLSQGEQELFMWFRIRVSEKAGEGPWRQHLYREFSRDEGMTERLNKAFYPNGRNEA